jgi:hypothetical protein
MTRRRPSDIARAIKALAASGVDIARIEIDSSGNVAIITATAPDAKPQDDLLQSKYRLQIAGGINP